MKILFIGGLDCGGAEHQMVIIAKLLSLNGYEVFFVTNNSNGFYSEELIESKVKIVKIPSNKMALTFKMFIPYSILFLYRLVKRENIDLGVFFQGVGKTYNLLGGETWLPGSSLGAGNIFTNIDDRWTKDNPSQNVFWPRMSDMTVANNSQASTWWLRDMSFLRLKNLEVGYTFPEMWMNKIGIRNCRVFLRGTNLLTFSKFKLWDPELDTTDGLKYPQMKSVSVGLSINFNN